jgi:hypothetical protein
MIKYLLFFLILLLACNNSFGQRILFQSDFENLTLSFPDSIPLKWKKLDADSNFFGVGKSWAVRDTNQNLGDSGSINRPQVHSGKKSLQISWYSGKGGNYVADDWVWTDSLRFKTGDSLIFWGLLGNTAGIAHYVDSLQIWMCSSQTPAGAFNKLATISSRLDTNYNVWTQYKFELSQFNGQRAYIGFRYYVNAVSALWCNLDDMFIGDRDPSVFINPENIRVEDFKLGQNSPNPFNPVTKINYNISESRNVELKIFNSSGEEIRNLKFGVQSPGKYRVNFDGSELSSGVYFYSLYLNGLKTETRKMILLK